MLRLGLISTAPVVALGLAVAFGLKGVLDIESTAVVALTAAAFVSVFALPIGMGVLQGYQRFFAIAALYVLPFALRLGLLALAIRRTSTRRCRVRNRRGDGDCSGGRTHAHTSR